jgi:uncharacterized membrane protein
MIIGALGVLDDVTISQVSTVMALRRANPGLRLRRLSALALDVGRDHVSATVNTLGLAYVGAGCPSWCFSARQTLASATFSTSKWSRRKWSPR